MVPTDCPYCGQESASLLPWAQRIAIGLTAGVILFLAGLALTTIGLWPALLIAPVVGLILTLWPIRRCTSCGRLSFRS
jgi:hypothetical protein